MKAKPYYIYVLLCADHSLYCGFTDNVERRFKAHQTFQGAKYTKVKSRHPLKLIYQEKFSDKHSALSAEYHFKHQSRSHKIAYLREHGLKIAKL